jgi:hypothetical protein
VIIVLGSEHPSRTRKIVAGVVGIALVALVWRLAAASNLYLVLNLALLALQTWLVGAWMRARARRPSAPRRRSRRPRWQRCANADRIEGMGNKAIRLARLLRADLPVPDGFVVSCTAVEAWRAAGTGARRIGRDPACLRRPGAQRVAVRSSGLNEDGSARSYAGVVRVAARRAPRGPVRGARGSRALARLGPRARLRPRTRRARRHRRAGHGAGRVRRRAVHRAPRLVRRVRHRAGRGPGRGAGLGPRRPDQRAPGRRSGRPLDATPAPIELAPLFELGRRVENLFGQPQDIEWAYPGGRFHLLQARDVTRLASQGTSLRALRERERARLLALWRGVDADEVVLAQSELSELLPRPTPYSLSWMSAMWNHGGSADRACAQLGIPYQVLPDSAPFVVAASARPSSTSPRKRAA